MELVEKTELQNQKTAQEIMHVRFLEHWDLQYYLICEQVTQKMFSLVTDLNGKMNGLSEQKCDCVSGNRAIIILHNILNSF
jgi:hypothetical protein